MVLIIRFFPEKVNISVIVADWVKTLKKHVVYLWRPLVQ